MLMERVRTAACTEIDVPVPDNLRHLGGSTRATLAGNPDGPVIVVLGGISGNRFICSGAEGGAGWWPGFVGPGCAVDPARHRVLGLDFAADAAGRIAPSTEEQARILCAALDAFGLKRADAVVGASYGGMVALSLAQHCPDRVGRLVIISAPAQPHPAATAIRELQRRVVGLGLATGQGRAALSIARGMAMLTYRTQEEFAERFTGGLPDGDPLGASEPGAYLHARGAAFHTVMAPERFLSLSASIDRHNIDPARIGCPVLLIGATTDLLVPPEQMEDLADALPDAELHLFDCLYGHDMFLKEPAMIGALAAPFLEAE